jgi:hypothetical protein
MEILKRVDSPTTMVNEDEVPRLDERESGFNRALRGDWGAGLSHERHRFVPNLKNKWWLDLKMWMGN